MMMMRLMKKKRKTRRYFSHNCCHVFITLYSYIHHTHEKNETLRYGFQEANTSAGNVKEELSDVKDEEIV